MSNGNKQIREACELYESFSGEAGAVIARVPRPDIPLVLAVIGEIDGLMYDTYINGKSEKFIHRFSRKARPLFCVDPKGHQIYLIGGEYRFTERGIVDKT